MEKNEQEFLKFLSNIYCEGFDAGMKCAIKQYSDILENLTTAVGKMDTTAAKEKARSLFEETMKPVVPGKKDENKSNVIDLASAKK